MVQDDCEEVSVIADGQALAGPPGAPDRPEYRYDGSGRPIGGPIIRNRLFYFASGSWNRSSQDIASLLSADAPSLMIACGLALRSFD